MPAVLALPAAVVRTATEADVEAVARLNHFLASRHDTTLEDDRLIPGISTLVGNRAFGELLVAEVGGHVVGCLERKPIFEPWFNRSYGYLDNVVVSPEVQGKGIGSLLVNQAKARAREAGARYLRLLLSEFNRSPYQAKACYVKAGFEPIGEMYECQL